MAFKNTIAGKALTGGLGGFGTALNIGNKIVGKKKKAENLVKSRESGIENLLSEGRPEYEVPEYVQQLIDEYGQVGADVAKTTSEAASGIREAGQQGLDMAKVAASRTEAPGSGLARERIGEATGGAISSIREAGGGIGSLGAVSDIYKGELGALRDLSAQDISYRSQAEQGLQSAYGQYGNVLSQASGIESQGALQGAQLQGQGLSTGAQYEDQAYQLNELDPYYDQFNYRIAQLGQSQSELERLKNRRAQMGSAAIGAVGDLAGSLLPGLIGG